LRYFTAIAVFVSVLFSYREINAAYLVGCMFEASSFHRLFGWKLKPSTHELEIRRSGKSP